MSELLEEFEELAGLGEVEELEGLGETGLFEGLGLFAGLELRAELVPEPRLTVPSSDNPLSEDDVPALVLAAELLLLVVLCVEPGSAAATAPAASTLATPTVAVAVFSLRRPRSRSATARETCRTGARPRGTPLRSSQLSIIAVWHPWLCASSR